MNTIPLINTFHNNSLMLCEFDNNGLFKNLNKKITTSDDNNNIHVQCMLIVTVTFA